MIEFGHLTHVGLRRELNEDTYYGDSEMGLWLVADGMGGHEYGEVASALAREAIVREIRKGRPFRQRSGTPTRRTFPPRPNATIPLPRGTPLWPPRSTATASKSPGSAHAASSRWPRRNWARVR